MALKTVWQEWGFQDVGDFLATTLGNKSIVSLTLQITVSSFAGYLAFIKQYIYDPPLGVAVIVSLLVLDTILGASVALKQGDTFNIAKFSRIVPILLSHLAILTLSHNIKLTDSITFVWLPNAIFGFFAMRTFLSVIRNLVTLGFVSGQLFVFVEKKLSMSLEDAINKNIEKSNQSHAHAHTPQSDSNAYSTPGDGNAHTPPTNTPIA